MIEAKDVAKHVSGPGGHLTILQDINLEVNAASSAAIVGPSGSGKTTLLGLLAGLDAPSEGEVWLDGRAITQMNEDERAQIRSESVGFVFQSFHLLPAFNAAENVMLPLELKGVKQAREEAERLLTQVGLQARAHHYPHQLSGGERQRVAIARAFAAEPRVLFADEPTGNLDRRTGDQISDLLFELNEKHATTLVLVTHDERLADRCSVKFSMDAGRIIV